MRGLILVDSKQLLTKGGIMKKFALLAALVSAVSFVAFSQGTTMKGQTKQKEVTMPVKPAGEWQGYVVDAMCAKGILKKDNIMERAAKHTKGCALEDECAASGFGLFYDSKYYKFDDAGSAMAKEAIQKSSREKNLLFDVKGTMDGDKIMVASLEEPKAENKDAGKKSSEMKKAQKQPAQKD